MSIQIRLGQGQLVSVCSQESVQRRRGMAAVEDKSYQGHEKAKGTTWVASGVIRIDQVMKGFAPFGL
jgi:hypothetical protein